MKKARMKIGSMLLALALVLTLLPVNALAEDETGVAVAAVAQVGESAYGTLADAVAAVPENVETTVRLLADFQLDAEVPIPAGKNIVLDLNGCAVTVPPAGSNGSSLYALSNAGVLTITDSSSGQSGSITARGVKNYGTMYMTAGAIDSCDSNGGGAAVWNEGTLSVSGGTLKTSGGISGTNAASAIVNQGGLVTITDGDFPCTYHALINQNGGTVHIEGGTFSTSGEDYAYTITNNENCTMTISNAKVYAKGGALGANTGKLVINSGEFRAEKWYALWVTNNGVTTDVTVNGGEFYGKNYGLYASVDDDGQDVSDVHIRINGGSFSGGTAAALGQRFTNNTWSLSVFGGTFSSDVSDYVAGGCEIIQRDGRWVVGTLDELAVARVGEQKYTSLKAAMDAAEDGETVTLLSDSTGNEKILLEDGRRLTLDLNGFDAGFALKQNISIYRGGLDLVGSGRLYEEEPWYAPVMLFGSDTDTADYSTVTVGRSVTLEGWAGLFINQLADNSDGANAFGVKAQVYGTLKSVKDTSGAGGHALYINGTIKATEGNVPQITLDGAVLDTELGNGMYLAGYAETTVTGTSITADTGIEIRAGKLTINDGTVITATAQPLDVTPNGNGSTTDGAGVAVAQHTTKLPIDVRINGGTIRGFSALYQSNPEENGPEDVAKVTIAVSGGSFQAINGGTLSVYSENKTGFITGGLFSSDPTAYLTSGYAAVDSGDTVCQYKVDTAGENAAQVVAGEAAVTVADTISGSAEQALADKVSQALKDTNVGGDAAPGIGEALNAAASTEANQNQVTAAEGQTELEGAGVTVTDPREVTIVVQHYLEISVAEVVIQDTTQTVTLDISPKYITVATTADLSEGENLIFKEDPGTTNAVQIGTAKDLTITKPVTVTLSLPRDFAAEGTLFVKHMKDSGRTYYYKGSVAADVLTFTNPNGFSLFSISTGDEVVASIGDRGYASLQEAVDAVENGGTISLEFRDGGTYTAVVQRNIRFTVDTAGSTGTFTITPGPGYECQTTSSGTRHTYTFALASAGGSSSGGSSGSHSVVGTGSVTGGKVTVSPARADRGDTVTVTVTPDEGYELGSLTVTDGSGDSIEVTYRGENRYTFTMPDSKVTVRAAFTAVEEGSDLPFTDVAESYWARSEIQWAYDNGYVNGNTADTFNPDGTITRQQVWMILARLDGAAPADMAAAKAWARDNGVSDGSAPGAAITRQQLAAMLYRFAQSRGQGFTGAWAFQLDYPDAGRVSEYAYEAMCWMTMHGVIGGTTAGTLNPGAPATRAQFCVMLWRFTEI